MVNKFLHAILAGILLIMPAANLRAARTQGAEFLHLDRGARAPALGGAVTAHARGVLAAQYNPAGLAEMKRGQLETSYQSLVEDINHGNFGWANPWGADGFGVDVKYIDYGSLDRTTLDENYEVAEEGIFGATEVAGGVFYGSSLYTNPYYRTNWGWGARIIHSRIENSAYAIGLTGGLQLISRDENLKAGAVVRNLGSQLNYQDRKTASFIPTDYRLGVSYKLYENTTGSRNLWGYYELDFRQAGRNDLSYSAGVEYTYREILSLRGGYNDRHEIDSGFSAGLGVKHHNLTVDYAFVPYGEFGTSHRLALKIDI